MKQLELFENLAKDELQKLKGLAASTDQDNISICCAILEGTYNYSFIQKATFVFEAQLNTISLDDWVDSLIGGGEPIKRSFKVGGSKFNIEDGYIDVNKDIYLTVTKEGERCGCHLYSYNDWIGNEDKDRPTAKSRAIQVQKFKELLKYWESCKQ